MIERCRTLSLIVLMALLSVPIASADEATLKRALEAVVVDEIEEHRVIIGMPAVYGTENDQESKFLQEHVDETARFACGLYKRRAVAFSISTALTGDIATARRKYLYACALK